MLLPITTPFDSTGDTDLQSLRANIGLWNGTGISGYVILGSTGERVNLDEREYIAVIEASRVEVATGKGGLAFIVGAGQQSTRATIDEIKRVSSAVPVDAFLVITPHFYRTAITQEALYKYYSAVADAAPVPVLLYSMPALTGIAIAPETVAQLSEHDNIIGFKDSSGDIINLAETVRLVPNDFAVLTGNGALLCAAMAAGAKGAILAVGCVAAKLCISIYESAIAGDHEMAQTLQRKLTPLARAVTVRYGIGGLKVALDMIGFCGGPVRAPLEEPGADARQEIALLLEAAGVIGDNVAGR